jgi:hypothetical protein
MSEEQTSAPTQTPAPEVLSVQSDGIESTASDQGTQHETRQAINPATPARRIAYRPNHKATFVGLIVVGLILGANAVILSLVMRNQATAEDSAVKNGVTLSNATLNQLGVSRNPVGNAETELVVGPNSKFGGKVTMSSDLNVGGQLVLNSKLNASDAALAKLQAGDTQLQTLNVNGDGTISTLNLRKDLQVAGVTRLQGQLTVNQLTTINNNMNVAGNLSVGGSLSVRNFQVANLTVAGHLISSGSTPGVSAGGATGSGGTATISGNDTSGTVAVNIGVGGGNGLLATVTFTTKYGSTPHVNVTPVGRSVPGLYVNRTSSGFTISADGSLGAGGYAFDYIVAQ